MTTKTTPPLQLFSTMGLKSPFPSVFTAAASRSEEAEEDETAEEDLRRHLKINRRNHHGHRHHPLDELTALSGSPTVPPVRPLRAQQQQQQQQQLHWATSSTSVTPGYVVSASSASITSSQWSEFTASSSTVVQQTSHQVSVSTSSSHQFQTIRSQQQVSSSTNAIPDAQKYLDDLQLPTQELDLAAQLGKSSMGRKGSLGTRRPPTIRSRKSSHGSLYYEVVDEGSHHVTSNDSSVVGEQTPSSTHVGSGANKIPPPRPPPPVFSYTNPSRSGSLTTPPQQQKPLHHQLPLPSSESSSASSASSVCSESAAVSTSSLEFCRSFASTPPPLPANSPPPLPDPDQLLVEFGLLHAALPAKRAATIDRSDAVSTTETITASEGGDRGSGGIRRRTIVTLGSSGSINVTLVTSSSQPDLLFRSDSDSLRVERTAPAVPVTVSASNSRASAFNVRRTIEQRRAQQQQQQQQQQQVAKEEEEKEEPVMIPVRTPPSSTYLYGEMGSPAGSSFLGSNRTMSISMSFDDLDTSMGSSSVAGAGGGDSVIRRDRGARKPEAWYERRQSYGFEAADKLQSLLNTSGSSDAMPSPSLVSRSCDSLSSTVRSSTASSQIEKMIPPWIIRNPSPGSATSSSLARLRQGSVSPLEEERQQQVNHFEDEEDQQVGSEYEVDLNYNSESEAEMEESVRKIQPTVEQQNAPTPTPSLQRSESSRSSSAQHLLTETPAAEPVWLRDLKVRRSLRETRRRSSSPIQQQQQQQQSPVAPSTGPPILDSIVSSTVSEASVAPVWLKVKLRPTGVNLVDDDPASSSPTKTSYTPIFTVTNSGVRKEPSPAASSEMTFKSTTKFSQVNINKETMATEVQGGGGGAETVLNHHKSIELMRMLEETPLVNVLGIAETLTPTEGSVYSIGGDGWTECSSTIASVRNSNEDLTASGGGASGGSVRMVSTTAIKVKKVAFGADVKEESDRKRSRPRRIRSRSPETRLRQWQEKLEEFKSSNSSIHLQPSQEEQQQPEALVLSDGEEAEFRAKASGLPVTRFGDTERKLETVAAITAATTAVTSSTTEPTIQTSETFRSLLQARAPYVIPQSVTTPVSSSSSSSSSSESQVTSTVTSVVNGIVNFDSSVERKIVILEETSSSSHQPPPKSILKKRSMENLLMDMPVRQLAAISSERPRINVTMTNQLKDPHPAMMEQQVLPWRIHLKHVEHPPLLHPPPQPLSEVSPWKADLVAPKKTTPPTVGGGGVPTAMKEQIPPPFRSETQRNNKTTSSSSSSTTTTTPGVPTAAEIIRNLRNPQPPQSAPSPPVVMMVARCEVKESTFIQPEEEEDTRHQQQQQQHEPLNNAKVAVAKDWGYHSLEQRPETGIIKAATINNVIQRQKQQHQHQHQQQQQQTTTIIDESIARLNETIEEIRAVASPLPSLDLITKRSSFHETSPRPFVSSSSSSTTSDSKIGILPAIATAANRSQVTNKRFSLGNEDMQPQVDESRQTYYQATSVVTHHHQSTGRFPLPPLPPPSPPPPPPSSSVAETPAATNADRLLRRRSTGSPARSTPFALRADVVRPPPTTAAAATAHQQAQLKADSNVRVGNNNKTITSTSTATSANVREERSTFVTASSGNDDGQREPIGMGVHTVVHHQNDRPSVAPAADTAAGVGTDASPGEESESDTEEVKVGKLVSRFESTASLSSTGSDAVRIKDKIKEMQSAGKLQSMTTIKSITTTQQQSSSSWSSSSSVTTSKGGVVSSSTSSSSSHRFEQQKSIELTSGMAEDKAALLVRKFFGNDSVIEPKKSRLAQTETIMERDETASETTTVTEQVEEEDEVEVEEERQVFDLPSVGQREYSPSDRAMTMSASSSFGSLLDDDRSIRTASSATTLTGASILRYSSCSERSVRLSDIIDRPDPESSASSPSELSISTSAVYTPPPPTRLIPSSRSNSRAETRSTTSASSTTTTTTTGSGSFRRKGSSNTRAQRGTISSVKRAVASKPPAIRPSATATRTANSSGVSSSTRTTRRANITARAATLRSDQQQQPPQPPPRMGSAGSIRAASAAWAKSLRTSAPTATAAARASARHPAAAAVTKSSSQGESSTGAVKPSSAAAAGGSSRASSSRLVTITSYSSRPGSTTRPEEAVSGIKVTPIAVGSGHYKIRMDQRLQASRIAASKTASSGTKTSSTSQRPSTSASKRPSRISQ